mmetsp:Transcript_82202/g.160441  ORF Transcript_82202/g.160441 Transcript_82202/m.160441 type:complete len:343 (-) Transcript_82202:134-1162(-)
MTTGPKVGRHAQLELVEEARRSSALLIERDKPQLVHLSGDAKTYLTCFVLFGLMATTQYMFGQKARSAALKADAISMACDSISFLGNLIAEWFPAEGPNRRRVELIAGSLSSLLLFGWTLAFAMTAVDVLTARDMHCGADVDGRLLMWCAVMNTLFDFASLSVYFWTRSPSQSSSGSYVKSSSDSNSVAACAVVEDTATSPMVKDTDAANDKGVNQSGNFDGDKQMNIASTVDNQVTQRTNDEEEGGSITDWVWFGVKAIFVPRVIPGVNMGSALLHLGADTTRSITTLVEASIILWGASSVCSAHIDAGATLVICIIICIGLLLAFMALAVETSHHLRILK